MKTLPKTILILIIVAALGLAIYSNVKKGSSIPTPTNNEPIVKTPTPIKITEEDITETNFTGKRPVITGDSVVVNEANAYITQAIDAFKKSADEDVPAMRAQFGPNSPTASYSIEIGATYLKGSTTESIVLTIYEYTGGANGNSLYQVFTAALGGNKIIPIKEAIKKDQQTSFLVYLKKTLRAWRPEGSTGSIIFDTEVANLTMDSIPNWSLDDKNFTVYFSKYQIGPGVLGAVAFPLPVTSVNIFLNKVALASKLTTPHDTSKDIITYTKASADLVTVDLPYPGAVTGKEFSVIGKARGVWYFEGSFPIELRDNNGKLLTTAIATAQGEWMTENFVPFKATIKAPSSYIGPATLVLKKDNASGLPEHDASMSFPITIEY